MGVSGSGSLFIDLEIVRGVGAGDITVSHLECHL